jgi:pimeloyl-ACP methyl ester carboxylesterase
MSLLAPSLTFLTPHPRQQQRPLFVFLPGLDGSGELLQVQSPYLRDAFDICCLAIPTQDRSDWPGLVAQLAALIAQERGSTTRPVVVCGESFGACLALELACCYPDWIQQLVLLNPASSLPRRPWLSWGSGLVPWLPEPVYYHTAAWLLPWLVAVERVAAADQQALLKAMQQVPAETVMWRLGLLNQFQVDSQRLESLAALEVVLVAGGADRLLPSVSEVKRLQAHLPQAQVVILPDSGHACLLEAEVVLADLLKVQGAECVV